ncbi:MAG: hypothetical protein M1812_005302 [Candelaria pacifica]|nr:MAG: hypothetical protein M1812_005302 [Candelaria pacifica]
MPSALENLPSELLHQIGENLWDDLPAIKSLRSSSSRMSTFGPLMEELGWRNILSFATKSEPSFAVLPFLYKAFTERDAYDERVGLRWKHVFMPDHRRRGGAFRYDIINYHYNASMLAAEVHEANPDLAFETYKTYYSEQQDILQNQFVTQLSTALAAFPRLRTVEVALPEVLADSLKPQQFSDIMYSVGMECPSHHRYNNRNLAPSQEDFPKDYLLKIVEAVAKSGRSLDTFIVNGWVWRGDRVGNIMRSPPGNGTEFEDMKKVLGSLRHLEFGRSSANDAIDDVSASAASPYSTKQILSLTPSLKYLSLEMGHVTEINLLAGLTWPQLKTFKLLCAGIGAEVLMEFLTRHLPALTEVKMGWVRLENGSWKPILHSLRGAYLVRKAAKKDTHSSPDHSIERSEEQSLQIVSRNPNWQPLKISVAMLSDQFGEDPFDSAQDEAEEIQKILGGYIDWTDRLEEVYGDE